MKEIIAIAKALDMTNLYRTQSGELWGVKLIEGKPVLHRLPPSQES